MFTFLEISEDRFKIYDTKIHFFRIFESFFQTINFLKILRKLSPEIRFFQYQFSFYYFIVFFYWILNILLNSFFQTFGYTLDLTFFYGFKTKNKFLSFFLIKHLLFIITTLLHIIGNLIFPILIDSFNFSIQKNLENFWVFDQLLKIQESFFFFFLILPEIFTYLLLKSTLEKDSIIYLRFWKIFLIFILIVSALFTPTLDNSIQILFSLIFLFFYFSLFLYLKKRTLINSLVGYNFFS